MVINSAQPGEGNSPMDRAVFVYTTFPSLVEAEAAAPVPGFRSSSHLAASSGANFEN